MIVKLTASRNYDTDDYQWNDWDKDEHKIERFKEEFALAMEEGDLEIQVEKKL